jgi:mono/diheme cytochrome c family protein
MPRQMIHMGLLACGVFGASSLGTMASAQETLTFPYKSGKEIYEHVCQACHMPDAKGAIGAGAYPALASNPKLEAGLYPVVVILQGLKSMPSFPDLDDEQIVAVTNYIRTSYGNNFTEPVTLEQVKTLRPTAVTRRRGRAG